MLNVQPAAETPDIERLLLDTARAASANTRLLVLAVTWVSRHGHYVSRARLARLVQDELEVEHQPTMGLMLESAKMLSAQIATAFDVAIGVCGSPQDSRPLSDVESGNKAFARLAHQRASVLSRKWGRWMSDIQLKENAW